MQTFLYQRRTIDSQRVAPFTGEGAYHGSTRDKAAPDTPRPPPPPMVEEVRPRTLEADEAAGRTAIADCPATFPDRAAVVAQLPVPSETAVVEDAVTFCWCPLETALGEAGPVTRQVLDAMLPHLTGRKRHTYVDSKIQYFAVGDLPVDSFIWHVDGSIVARGERAQRRGHRLLHDMRARMDGEVEPPRYLAYLSSDCSATEFTAAPVTVTLPTLIPSFDLLDQRVREADPPVLAQPAGSVVRFDGLSLHRARHATRAGWRLWIRVVETDREVRLSRSIIECYNTVFQPSRGS